MCLAYLLYILNIFVQKLNIFPIGLRYVAWGPWSYGSPPPRPEGTEEPFRINKMKMIWCHNTANIFQQRKADSIYDSHKYAHSIQHISGITDYTVI